MAWLFSHNDDEHTALIVDIGSGSVGLALIHTVRGDAHPEIIWTHREFSLIKDVDANAWSLREINTAIINAFLKFGNEGIKAQRGYKKKIAITSLQVCISAPWAYTITKTINYSEENPFTVSETLLKELRQVATKKALENVLQLTMLNNAGLTTIDNQTIGILANDYVLESSEHVETKALALIHLTAITHQRVLDTIDEVRGKMLPRSNLSTHSFMTVFYDTLRRLHPDTTESCLIDVTNEATEIGVIRENLLRHTSYAATGAFSIARAIAALSKIPKEEAFTYIRGGEAFILNKLSDAKQQELEAIFDGYVSEITALFKETGDALAIPKTIYLHCDADTEAFFKTHLARAAKAATGIEHVIYPITSTLLEDTKTSSDTAILLSAQYFHNHVFGTTN